MHIHKSSDYKLSAVKYYLSHYKGSYDRNEKRPSTRKRKPNKYLDQDGVLNVQRCNLFTNFDNR